MAFNFLRALGRILRGGGTAGHRRRTFSRNSARVTYRPPPRVRSRDSRVNLTAVLARINKDCRITRRFSSREFYNEERQAFLFFLGNRRARLGIRESDFVRFGAFMSISSFTGAINSARFQAYDSSQRFVNVERRQAPVDTGNLRDSIYAGVAERRIATKTEPGEIAETALLWQGLGRNVYLNYGNTAHYALYVVSKGEHWETEFTRRANNVISAMSRDFENTFDRTATAALQRGLQRLESAASILAQIHNRELDLQARFCTPQRRR